MPKTEINFPAHSFALIGLVLVSLLTSGCGSLFDSAGKSTEKPAAALQITVTPASAQLRTGAKAQFSAKVTHSTNQKVLWSVNGIAGGNASVGKVDATGLYSAPVAVPSPNPVSVEATSMADDTVSANAMATVQNPVPALSSVLPASIRTGSFTISVSGNNFASGAVVVWGTKFLSTTFVSPHELRATGDEPVAGTVKVTVLNPDPGSTSSAAFNVTVAAPLPNLVSPSVAARFLEQATWGPTPALISMVQQQGIEQHLNVQLSYGIADYAAPADGEGMDVVQTRFFLDARTKANQLRQRVAFALSQIMVVSANKVNNPSAFVLWQNMMQRDAFGNFLTLLTDVTLSPTMGNYLDMVNNDKPNPSAGTAPNENYAREVLQLFTIGLEQLNQDGTLQVDGSGNPIPTYSQEAIEGFAHAFTGWTYPTKPGRTGRFGNSQYYGGPMIAFDDHHDTGQKELLNGVILPAGGTAQSDLTAALQNIFQHPNVGPFIGKRLIQHLVTSNPSPEYVGRVAAVFNNNGNGVRGDLRAVVKAILLDPEARRGDDPAQAEPNDGRLKEPVQFMMNLLQALNSTGSGACLAQYAATMKQSPFFSPSVFNFFHPEHVIEGTNLLGPEFEILDAGTTINRINFVHTLVYSTPCEDNRVHLEPYVALAKDVPRLVDTIASIMMHGNMSPDMRSTIVSAVSPITDETKRTKAVLYLVGTSSQFQVQH